MVDDLQVRKGRQPGSGILGTECLSNFFTGERKTSTTRTAPLLGNPVDEHVVHRRRKK